MEVVLLRCWLLQLITTDETGRQTDDATAGHHQHGQITAGADAFPQGASGRPGWAHVALGVLHPVQDQFQQLIQEGHHLLVAAHQGFLGEIDGRGFVLTIGQPSLESSEQIAVESAPGIGERRLHAVEAQRQGWCWSCLHQAGRFEAELVGAADEAQSLDFIATGCQQLPPLLWMRQHGELMLQQLLKPLPAGFEAEPMLSQRHRRVVAVVQAVNDSSTHAGSVGMERRSALVK